MEISPQQHLGDAFARWLQKSQNLFVLLTIGGQEIKNFKLNQ